MVEDPKWELAILATVQGFYEKLLQDSIGGEIPVPAGLEAISLQEGEGEVHATLDRMRRWLRLLDQAITPAMLRRAFTTETDPEIAEAVLRYFTRKKDTSDVNRDKTDLVATFLYRHPRVPGQWERRGFGLDGSLPLSPFEIALIEILADNDVPFLSEEHVQLLRRFDPLQEEAQNCRDLNALLESEIITRVRELKQALDSSFYHPGVLATIAPYNAAFGAKFDEFFHAAATEIREFALALQEQGGSILGNVEGVDGTVEHVVAARAKAGNWLLQLGDRTVIAGGERQADGALSLVLDGVRRHVMVLDHGSETAVFVEGESWRLVEIDPLAPSAGEDPTAGRLTAPMPGRVTQLMVAAGTKVRRGEPLIIIEAMKMEHTVAAPADGVVEAVHFAVGDLVEEGAELIALALERQEQG